MNKFKRLLFLLSCCLFYLNANSQGNCFTCTSSNSINSGLIWCHPFNGNANDVTGNGYNGVVSGATLIADRNSVPNSAYQFDGMSSYIDIPKLIPSTLTTFSFSIWIKPGTNSSNCFFFWEGNSACGNDIFLVINGSKISLGANKGSSLNGLANASDAYTFASSINNVWTHLVFVMTASQSKLYANGSLILTSNTYADGSGYNFPACYGAKNDGGGGGCGAPRQFYYTGGLDDVRFYNRAISAAEVLALYNNITTLPAITPIADRVICPGDSIQVNPIVSNASTFLWTPNYKISNPNILNPYFKPSVDTNYILTASNGSCAARDTFRITRVLVSANAGSDKNICKRQSILLNGSGSGGSFSWLPIKNIVNNLSATPTVNPDTTTTYILTVTNGSCVVRDTVTVFVNPINVNITNKDTVFCLGDTLYLDGTTNGSTYTWSPNTTIYNSSSLTPYAIPTNDITYYLTASDVLCTVVDSVKFTLTNISVNAGIDTTICLGESVQLVSTSSPGVNFKWTPSIDLNFDTISNPIASPKTDTTYTLTVQKGSCKASDQVAFKVKPLPSVSAGLDKQICFDGMTILNGVISNQTSFDWTPATGLNDTKILTPTVRTNINSTYILMAQNGKCWNSDTVEVRINKLDVDITNKDTTFCLGDTIYLKGTTSASSFQWTPNTNLFNSTTLNPYVIPTTDISYFLTASDLVCSYKDSVKLTLTNINVDAGIDTTICFGESVQLFASGSSGVTYKWTPASDLNFDDIINPLAAPKSDITYTLNVKKGNCKASDQVAFTVKPLPSVSAGLDKKICFDGVTTLDGLVSNQTSFLWTPALGLSDAKSLFPEARTNVNTSFVLIAQNGRCWNSDTVEVKVNSKVIALFSADPSVAIAPATIQFNNSSSNAYFYNWDFDDKGAQSIVKDPSYLYKNTGTYTVWLLAKDSLGCKDSISLKIILTLEPYLHVPNVFTPDNDAINDSFVVVYNPGAFEYLEYDIYNRWGQHLYYTKMPEGSWWDGTFEGKPCPGGVYFYIVRGKAITGKYYDLHGTVTLLK
ncbi:MAG: hypothetical protein CFE21_16895 [Bacteroidetes bacterium B1(2017)]|nr:MAG: hypothetical protein CFE21_16895 [Bacteroidetes bacterium B1(2017)]